MFVLGGHSGRFQNPAADHASLPTLCLEACLLPVFLVPCCRSPDPSEHICSFLWFCQVASSDPNKHQKVDLEGKRCCLLVPGRRASWGRQYPASFPCFYHRGVWFGQKREKGKQHVTVWSAVLIQVAALDTTAKKRPYWTWGHRPWGPIHPDSSWLHWLKERVAVWTLCHQAVLWGLPSHPPAHSLSRSTWWVDFPCDQKEKTKHG